MAQITALTQSQFSTHKPKRASAKSAPKSGVGRPDAHRCVICGKRLKGRQLVTCSASHRVALSKIKRRLVDNVCQDAFHWQPGEGEALVQQYGLPRVEAVLGLAGWHWQADRRAWVKIKQEAA